MLSQVCIHTPPSVSPKPEKRFKFAPEVDQQEGSMSGRDSLQYRKETKATRRSIRAELKMLVDSEMFDPLPEVAEVQQDSAMADEIKDEESQATANARLRERLLRSDLDVSESEDSDCSECDEATAGDRATLPAKNPGVSPENSIVEEKVVHQQQHDGPVAVPEPWIYDVDETANNYEVADSLPDDDIKTDMKGLVAVVPVSNKKSYHVYTLLIILTRIRHPHQLMPEEAGLCRRRASLITPVLTSWWNTRGSPRSTCQPCSPPASEWETSSSPTGLREGTKPACSSARQLTPGLTRGT